MKFNKMELWKKILIVVSVIFLIFFVSIIRKMIIIIDLQDEANKYLNLDNYHIKNYLYQGGNIGIIETYRSRK